MMKPLEKMFKSLTTIKGLEKIKEDMENLAVAIVHLSSAVQLQAEAIRELYTMMNSTKKVQPTSNSTAFDLTLNQSDKKKNVKPN
jgi:hypothetical protein